MNFTVEEIMGNKALEFKCKLYGYKYAIADPIKEKGGKFTAKTPRFDSVVSLCADKGENYYKPTADLLEAEARKSKQGVNNEKAR